MLGPLNTRSSATTAGLQSVRTSAGSGACRRALPRRTHAGFWWSRILGGAREDIACRDRRRAAVAAGGGGLRTARSGSGRCLSGGAADGNREARYHGASGGVHRPSSGGRSGRLWRKGGCGRLGSAGARRDAARKHGLLVERQRRWVLPCVLRVVDRLVPRERGRARVPARHVCGLPVPDARDAPRHGGAARPTGASGAERDDSLPLPALPAGSRPGHSRQPRPAGLPRIRASSAARRPPRPRRAQPR
mmetsp:Transcript_51303/g.170021  ORF Transcript_51303/g.170021 Transcript_51303/m.170021 type:complete len:248 (+) Transcript_51303:172-915(+)